MFWGAFTWGAHTQLVVVSQDPTSDRKGVTARVILEMYQEHLPQILEVGQKFVQDNAPVHTAYIVDEWVEEWCREHGVEVIEWPPYSPDLSPIENVWAILKQRLYKQFPELASLLKSKASLEMLINAAKHVWDTFEDEELENLIDSMPDCIEAVVQAKGWYTRY